MIHTEEYKQVVEGLKKEFSYTNVHQVPKLLKIVVGMSVTEALKDKGVLEKVAKQLEVITGQKPLITKARVSISTFKLRKGAPIGLKVTLRGARMFDFWTKLVRIVLPRMRDFRGIDPKGFDGQGNLNIGFKEQGIFADLEYDAIDKVRGLEVTIVTTAGTNEEAHRFMERLGMPFIGSVEKHGKNE